MKLEVDLERLRLAHKAVRAELLAERSADGHWEGRMSSSPLATAAAVSALVVAYEGDAEAALVASRQEEPQAASELMIQGELSELLVESLHWLARCQNADGGWGDCDASRSNLAATMLVQAAFRLTGVPAKYADLIARADDYVAAQDGPAGLRRLDGREMLAAPILANCALAGMVPWRQVPTLPFELTRVPKKWQRLFHLSFDPQGIPAILAVGIAKFHHDPPHNPLSRLVRHGARAKSLVLLERLQAADGSFFDTAPLTAFVVMCLAGSGCHHSPVVRRGVEFLLASVRPDASWSIYSNLAVANTAAAIHSLSSRPMAAPVRAEPAASRSAAWTETAHVGDLETHEVVADGSQPTNSGLRHQLDDDDEASLDVAEIDWLLDAQHTRSDSAANVNVLAGGWGWSNAPGAVPNVDDTAAALLALADARRVDGPARRERLERSARLGVRWLLDEQNDDGGWPTGCQVANYFSTDHSGTDLTAEALRAISAWQREWRAETPSVVPPNQHLQLDAQISAALKRGVDFLQSQQRDDGCFVPVRFGNELQPDESNPVVGTALVLSACAELTMLDSEMAGRAANWLLMAQHAGGGWGPPRVPLDYSGTYRPGTRTWRENYALAQCCTVEETALTVAALLPLAETNAIFAQAVSKGLTWLADAVEQDRHRRPAVIGWCFTRLWYHERLGPLLLACGALSRAFGQYTPQRAAAASVG